MPEENDKLTEAEMLRQKQIDNGNNLPENNVQNNPPQPLTQKQINDRNNANMAKNVADVASKSANPYAKAAGTAVKAVDKLTGGKASEKLGKALTTANKLNGLQGKLLQKTSNKMAESGTADRIGNALRKKKKSSPISAVSNMKSNAVSEGKEDTEFSRREVEEQTTDGGGTSFKTTVKVLKIGMIAFTPIMTVVIFMNLIVAATQTFLGVIGLGDADKVSDAEADKEIRENGSEGLDQEITDENVDEGITYIHNEDIFIEDYIFTIKLKEKNFIASTKNRKYNEADLKELEDYYSSINTYKGGKYNMNHVYQFFFKLFYIQRYYSDDSTHNVDLDMPLIMSILSVQSEDKSEVFIQNIKDYSSGIKTDNPNFSFDKDWSNEVLSKNSSTHDIEILAQNMVKRVEDSSCSGTIDGACYELVDEKTYKEFLKGFLEKKYYLKNEKLGKVPATYKFINNKNKTAVNNLIVQIYDAKAQYEDLAGDYEETEEIITVSNNNSFWWPIGSKDTEEINGVLFAKGQPETINITSYYNVVRTNVGNTNPHGGIDISKGYTPGIINVIAAKSGEVIYPTNKSQTQFLDNGNGNDGGGYGNYVVIKHSDGTYTYYAHLAQNSIDVMAGDVVQQGQFIGKMGHSGNSTGNHLHFEIRVGQNTWAGRANPLDYVDPKNPRPISSGSGSSFSLTTTTLSREEFIARMNDYYKRTGNENFNKNFVSVAGEIYDVALKNNLNPELAVVTAGTEQSWALSSACQYTHNFWGIGIPNGAGCNAGGKYDSVAEGVAAYAQLLKKYGENGEMASMITSRYKERSAASCDAAGHGMPGTLEGMQSVYSWVGDYRYNPGSSGSGGCYYLNLMYENKKNYCSTVPTCSDTSNCPKESKTTVCEQNDYTAYQLKGKMDLRYDIFGL